MDLGALITSIVLLLICIIPFVLMSVNNKKREKKSLQGLSSLAEQHNSKITRYELWDNSLIGIDDTNSKLFFIRKVNESETTKKVDLAEIQRCRVLDNSRMISNKEGNYKVTDQVELAFTYHDRSKKETALEFYNVNESLMLKGELQLAEKWSKIINEAILPKTN